MTRWVLHTDALDDVDTEPLLRHLADDIAADARALAPERTGDLKASIRVEEVDDHHAVVVADATRQQKKGPEAYAYWVEKGTSDTKAQPFLRPALYKYRAP